MSTHIEWTDETWNPVVGCSRVSLGCDNCYAMRQARRHDRPGNVYEGLTRIGTRGVDWSGVLKFVPERLSEPLRRRKPTRWFVNSMSDLFHPKVTDEEIAAVFFTMAMSPQHTFQVLTKRPERMRKWFEWVGEREHIYELAPCHVAWGARCEWDGKIVDRFTGTTEADARADEALGAEWPLPNVWLGVSGENQEYTDERWQQLAHVPAAVRFISMEPLLGPVSMVNWGRRPDWVIVGGESGNGARPCALEWIESLVKECRAAKVACFVKQVGAYVVSEHRTATASEMSVLAAHPEKLSDGDKAPNGEFWAWRAGLKHSKGGDPEEWPDDLCVREMPQCA